MMVLNFSLLFVFQLAAFQFLFRDRENLLHRAFEFVRWFFTCPVSFAHAYSISRDTFAGVPRNFALAKSTFAALTFAAFSSPAIVNSVKPIPSIPTTSPDLSTSIVTIMPSEPRSKVFAILLVRNRTYMPPHCGSNSITGGLGLCTLSLWVSLCRLISGNQPAVTGLNLGYYFQGTAVNGFFKYVNLASMLRPIG